MQEAEVSLLIALYYIKQNQTDCNVTVSIDGAHIKTGNTVHFDIWGFIEQHGMKKTDGDMIRWQGEYSVNGYNQRIMISSVPGIGDVNIQLKDGRELYIESKKGKDNKQGQEYPLMREAIGQLMTGCPMRDRLIPVVAVPYSEKSNDLACRWSEYKQIKLVGIKFFLVKENGEIVVV